MHAQVGYTTYQQVGYTTYQYLLACGYIFELFSWSYGTDRGSSIPM